MKAFCYSGVWHSARGPVGVGQKSTASSLRPFLVASRYIIGVIILVDPAKIKPVRQQTIKIIY